MLLRWLPKENKAPEIPTKPIFIFSRLFYVGCDEYFCGYDWFYVEIHALFFKW